MSSRRDDSRIMEYTDFAHTSSSTTFFFWEGLRYVSGLSRRIECAFGLPSHLQYTVLRSLSCHSNLSYVLLPVFQELF